MPTSTAAVTYDGVTATATGGPPYARAAGGWEMLASLRDELRQAAEDSARREAYVCPICGNVLTLNERGEGNCDVGHYRTGQAAR